MLFSLLALAEKAVKFSKQSVLRLDCYLNECDPESSTEYFSCCVTDRQKRRRIASLDLLATLMLTWHRMQLAFFLLQGRTADAFNLFARSPRSFSARLLSRWSPPAGAWNYSLPDAGLCVCFPWILRFLSAHFLQLLEVLLQNPVLQLVSYSAQIGIIHELPVSLGCYWR